MLEALHPQKWLERRRRQVPGRRGEKTRASGVVHASGPFMAPTEQANYSCQVHEEGANLEFRYGFKAKFRFY